MVEVRDRVQITMLEANRYLRMKLIHALLRVENDETDAARAREVLVWAGERLTSIAKTFDPDERSLLDIIWKHWVTYKEAPSRRVLGDLAARRDKSDGMGHWLKAYDEQTGDLPPSDRISAASDYAACAEDHDMVLLYSYLQTANTMLVTSVPESNKPNARKLLGVRDARTYLIQNLQSGVFAKDSGTVGGSMVDLAPTLATIYDDNERRARDNTLFIPTGIRQLDEGIHGIRRRTLNLILGGSGQRKSAMARTLAYNAAMSGQRVLFIPLEESLDDELSIFAVMHACNSGIFEDTETFTVDRFLSGVLTPEEKDFLKTELIPDLINNVGDRLILKKPQDTSWASVRSLIEMENFVQPLDMVMLDYFTLMSTEGTKDKTAAIDKNAFDVKQFVLNDLDNGRGGIAFVAPVQGSRKGKEEADAQDGNWTRQGIYMYVELEKSADLIMFVWFDPNTPDFIKVGTCKARKAADVPAQIVTIDHGSHLIGGSPRKDRDVPAVASQGTLKDAEFDPGYGNAG